MEVEGFVSDVNVLLCLLTQAAGLRGFLTGQWSSQTVSDRGCSNTTSGLQKWAIMNHNITQGIERLSEHDCDYCDLVIYVSLQMMVLLFLIVSWWVML